MPRTLAMLLLLFLAGSIVWWQVGFIRLRLSEDDYAGERGVLIALGSFITIVLALNGMNVVDGLQITWEMSFQEYAERPSRLTLLMRQVGLLGGFYVFAMVFWHVIRRRVLDLEREIWEPRIEYGLTERQRLLIGFVLAIISVPAVLKHGFAPLGGIGMKGSLILLVMVPVSLFSIELLFGAVLAKFLRLMHERDQEIGSR